MKASLPTYYQACTSIGVTGAKSDSCFLTKTLAIQLLSVIKVRIARCTKHFGITGIIYIFTSTVVLSSLTRSPGSFLLMQCE